MPLRVPKFDQLDADTNAFFPRQLEAISTRMFKREYAERRVRALVPPNREVPPGAKSYTYRQWDRTGIAKIMADGGSDIPRANAFGIEVTSKIVPLAIAFDYTFNEIRSAALAAKQVGGGQALDQMRADACREGFEDKVDEIGSIGNAQFGLFGMLNQPNVPSFTIPNGAATSPLWSTKTPDEIIKDVNNFGLFIWKLTKQRESMKRLLLPSTAYSIVANTPRSSVSDTTILEFLLRTNKYFSEVEPWTRLDGAGAGGTDRMMGYTPDPMKLGLVIPMEQTLYPPQTDGLRVVINTEGEIGGVVFHKPYSACYADGL